MSRKLRVRTPGAGLQRRREGVATVRFKFGGSCASCRPPEKIVRSHPEAASCKFQDGQSGADFLRGLGVSEASAV